MRVRRENNKLYQDNNYRDFAIMIGGYNCENTNYE